MQDAYKFLNKKWDVCVDPSKDMEVASEIVGGRARRGFGEVDPHARMQSTYLEI
jgi:hypothetical protein